MRKILFFCFAFLELSALSQVNLVPNASFEDTVGCPQGFGTIPYATGWMSFSGSADYFNPCTTTNWGVPYNFNGYKLPYDGKGYAGAMTQTLPMAANSREHFGIQLIHPLTVGQNYFVSFKVSLSDNFIYSCWSNKVGAKFTTFTMNGSYTNPILMNNYAHVYSDSLIKDTSNWVTISGSFTADSAYKYIVLGNFFDDAHTDTMSCNGKSRSYVYFDSVFVAADSSNELHINKSANSIHCKIYPNPNNGNFVLQSSSEVGSFSFFNTLGELLLQQRTKEKSFVINLSVQPPGIYFLHVQGQVIKVIKE